MRPPRTSIPESRSEFIEKVVQIDRVSRVVKGGRRFRFRATVVLGDGAGRVGIGIGKGSEVITAIGKAVEIAKKKMLRVNLRSGTIPHEVQTKFGGATVLLKPAAPGTGVIAGGAIRAVVEAAGISDVLSKSLGSANKLNNVQATFLALQRLSPADKRWGARSSTAPEAPSEVVLPVPEALLEPPAPITPGPKKSAHKPTLAAGKAQAPRARKKPVPAQPAKPAEETP